MRGDLSQQIDPLRVRSLGLRKRSLLRKNSPVGAFDETLLKSTTAHRYVHFVKPEKKRPGRRAVRFAPLVDVFETVLSDDFTEEEFDALWTSREDYENAKQEFSDVVTAMHRDGMDSADLLIYDDELPPDHPFVKYCVRGCEKYFDLHTRHHIRYIITQKVVEFYRKHPEDSEALRVFSRALTAECSDLAFFHGKLNALQCWGRSLQRYQDLKRGLSRHIFAYSVSQSFSRASEEEEEGLAMSCGVEVILDPSATAGSRALPTIM